MCFVAKGCFPANKKKTTEDKLFFESMIADRKAFLGKIDVKSVKQETTNRQREEKQIERSAKCKKRMAEKFSTVSLDEEIENDCH